MKKNMYRLMLELTHNRFYNTLIKQAAGHALSKSAIRPFAKTFRINEEELEKDLNEYRSLSDFFTRELKTGSRPVSKSADDIVSPVDGVISEAGELTEGGLLTVKGRTHSLKTMLGLKSAADRYARGHYVVLYLSPKDYHRIHAPFAGMVKKRWALGGYSEPVNDLGFKYGREVLATNYRLITEIAHDGMFMAVVKVGALNVNSVHPSHVASFVEKGEEMAYFSFGSSVVLLFEPDTVKLHEHIVSGVVPVKQGETIGIRKKEENT